MKVDAPKTRKQFGSVIEIVNNYKDLWPQRLHILSPLPSLTLSKAKWEWTEQCQQAFENMKKHIAKKQCQKAFEAMKSS
jgi:hypothetical protein